MDSLDNASKNTKGFFKYVFNFDDDTKSNIMNIIQYALLAIIPIIIINKTMQKYVPEASDEKGSLEIIIEVLLQIIIMFISGFFINRIIQYYPTYSGEKYPETNVIYNIIPVLTITLSLQTKLGEKVGILVDRIVELWDNNIHKKPEVNEKKTKIIVSKPISQQPNINEQMYSGGNDGFSTNINQLPTISSNTEPNYNINTAYSVQQPQQQNYNMNMIEGSSEIMAASDVLGGAFGGSTF